MDRHKIDLVQTFIRTYQLFFFSGQKINVGLKIIHVIFITLNHSMYPGVFSLVYFSAYISNTVYCLLFFLERYGISLCILIDLPSS